MIRLDKKETMLVSAVELHRNDRKQVLSDNGSYHIGTSATYKLSIGQEDLVSDISEHGR